MRALRRLLAVSTVMVAAGCGDDEGVGGDAAGPSSVATSASSAEAVAASGSANSSQGETAGTGGQGGDGGGGDGGGAGGEATSLRITEIGSCFFEDSSCWLEVRNEGAVALDLADYSLRSTGVRVIEPRTPSASADFELPSVIVPAHGYAIIRGATSHLLVDGPQVVHVRDGATVPFWTESGFIEIAHLGRTVDFVRFGESDEPPTDADGWTSGSADALAFAADAYGRSLARDVSESDTDAPADWTVRAFATPCGTNDVTEDADEDDDGIPDQAEREGGTYAGLDLYAWGAREGTRDVFVQIDHMASDDPAITPREEALVRVVAAFAPRGIAVHLDVGPLYTEAFDPARFNLEGGETVPYAPSIALVSPAPGQATVWDYKAAHFDPRLQAVAHYVLWGSTQFEDDPFASSGHAELPGNDVIITLGGWGFEDATEAGRTLLVNEQAMTLMHELGHNLGLHHGGGSEANEKPNYLSVMNYLYQLYGLPVIGSPTEGDRYALDRGLLVGDDCGITDVAQLDRGPFDPEMLFDYSSGLGATIVESSVDETAGLGQPGSGPVDFDCDGDAADVLSLDVNFDEATTSLADFDDWSHVELVFSRTADANESGAAEPRARRPGRVDFDPMTQDRQPTIGERRAPERLIEAMTSARAR